MLTISFIYSHSCGSFFIKGSDGNTGCPISVSAFLSQETQARHLRYLDQSQLWFEGFEREGVKSRHACFYNCVFLRRGVFK